MQHNFQLLSDNNGISEKILIWYQQNKRNLPWRDNRNPYFIWLSEIILQQTRVAQGLPYYLKFVATFPRLQDLADAPEQEVLRLWQGLGYYSRARNMHQTAQFISQELNGNFPDNYRDLLKLKGVGDYTAAAIASFAYQEKVAVLDGNVFRVLARIFGVETDIASNEGKKQFSALANDLLPPQNSDLYNQAIMEFGALQCTPQKPACTFCPLNQICVANQRGLQGLLPVKINKTKIKTRYFYYFWIEYDEKILMRQRPETNIWAGLYEPFLIETDKPVLPDELLDNALFEKHKPSLIIKSVSEQKKHILTHRKILAQFWHIELNEKPQNPSEGYNFYTLDEIEQLPKPILIAKEVVVLTDSLKH